MLIYEVFEHYNQTSYDLRIVLNTQLHSKIAQKIIGGAESSLVN